MKNHLSLIIGAASLAVAAGSYAQTATTDPVGYITINVAGTPSGRTFSGVAPTLTNKVELAGVVSAISPDGKTVTVPSFTGTFTSGFWLEVTNGLTSEGAWTNVTGNTATTITLEDDMGPFITAGTSTIKVRKHVTIGEFFGATNSAGLQGGADPGLADEIIFLGDRGVAAQNVNVFYDPSVPGWFTGNFDPADNMAIEPGEGVLIARRGTTSISFVQVGHVKTGKSMTSLLAGPAANDAGENVLAVRSAVGVSLDASDLHTGNNATGVASGADPGLADEVILFVNGIPKIYFNDGTGWFDADFAPAGTVILPEGTGLYIKRKAAGDAVITTRAVTIAP